MATPADHADVVRLMRGLYEEDGSDIPLADGWQAFVLGDVATLLADTTTATFLAVTLDGIVGMISAGTIHYPTAFSPFGVGFGFYVQPDARHTRASRMLMDAVLRWAKGMGLKYGVMTIHRDRKEWARMGFVETGRVMVTEL